jgi:hypothetical protein
VQVLAPATWNELPSGVTAAPRRAGPQNRDHPLADPERLRAAAASRDGVKPSGISRDLGTAVLLTAPPMRSLRADPTLFSARVRHYGMLRLSGSDKPRQLRPFRCFWGAATKNRCIVADAALKAVVCQFRHRYLEFKSLLLRQRVTGLRHSPGKYANCARAAAIRPAPLGRSLLRGGHDESVRFGRLCTTGTIRTQR